MLTVDNARRWLPSGRKSCSARPGAPRVAPPNDHRRTPPNEPADQPTAGRPATPLPRGAMRRPAHAALLTALLVAACGRGPTYDLGDRERARDGSGIGARRRSGTSAFAPGASRPSRPLRSRHAGDRRNRTRRRPGVHRPARTRSGDESYKVMVRDGVTSAFELEVGTGDVAAWYATRVGGQIVNYGVSVGHIKARMQVLGDPSTGLLPAGVGGSRGGHRAADRRRWRRFSGRGSPMAPWRWGSGAPTRPAPRWTRSNVCFGSPARPARRPTSTCGAVSPGSIPPSPLRPTRRRSCTSCTSTRAPVPTSRRFSPTSRRPGIAGRTSRPRPIRMERG